MERVCIKFIYGDGYYISSSVCKIYHLKHMYEYIANTPYVRTHIIYVPERV